MQSLLDLGKAVVPTPVKDLVKSRLDPRHFDPSWHRRYVGGMWEEIGTLQFEFMVARGLKPEHYFLDVGCGALRGGAHYINYLEAGHYFGIDRSPEIIEAARNVELPKAGLVGKRPRLMVTDTFDFRPLNQKFDFAIAQSVFTHVPLNDIILCLMRMEQVLQPGGRFFATFWENPEGKRNLEPLLHYSTDGADFPTFFDRDGYHYDVGTFEWVCEGTSLKVEYIGDWNHPRDQRMIAFVKQ